MNSQGDLIVASTDGKPDRLAKGTDGQVLSVTSGNVGWTDLPVATDTRPGLLSHESEGTFAPTLTGASNVDSVTLTSASYYRQGKVVTISIQCLVDATASATPTSIQFPVNNLPFTQSERTIIGTAYRVQNGADNGIVGTDATNTNVFARVSSMNTTLGSTWSLNFTYLTDD